MKDIVKTKSKRINLDLTKYMIYMLILFFTFHSNLFSQTYSFTTAGATGRYGPTQTQLNTAYISTNLNGIVTTTNGVQNWTIPVNGIYKIEAYGAKGGNGSAPIGGSGAKMVGEFSLTVGQVLKILVGQVGSNGLVGGGGGASFVTNTSNAPLIVAGGGGGNAYTLAYSFGQSNNIGNNGTSGLPGSNGNASISVSSGGALGGGGGVATTYTFSQGSGGGGLIGNGNNGNPSTGGLAFINGGNGGAGTVNGTDIAGNGGFGGGGGGDWVTNTGGGGGGGYSGGGGGTYAGLGGGGGSFNSGINQVNVSGFNAGNGYVVFTKLTGVNIVQTASVLCSGQLTAALTASAFGGTAPYSYSWSPAVSSGSVAIGLGAGAYTCYATDVSSVMYTNTFVITQPPLLLSTASQTNVSCFGGFNGSAKVNVSGGVGSYSYSWSPTSTVGSSISGLSIGTYTCQIKDANNCTNSVTYIITQPSALTVFGIASNPTVCSGNSTTLLGGGALTYIWSNGVSNAMAFIPTATNNYTLTGTDAAGCTATAIAVVVVNPSPNITISGSNTVCTGNSIILTASGANTYTWNNSSNSASITVSPTVTTSYSISGNSSNGCQNTALKIVTVLNTTSVNANASSPAVCIGNVVTLFGSGANTYTWSGGITNNVVFSPSVTSTYSVAGTGACGTASASISINVNAMPSVVANASSTIVCTGSTLNLSGSGAASYLWSGGVTNNVPFALSLNSTFTVTGTDANGCQNTAIKTISVNSLPAVTASVSAGLVCAGAPVTFNGGGANTYSWTNGVINNSPFSPSTSGSYVVTGSDLNGCQNTATTTVNVIIVPVVTANSSTSSICSGNSVTLFGSGAISYIWSSGITNNVAFTPTATSSYTVSGSNSCFTTSNVITVTVNSLPVITANATNSVVCLGNMTTLFGSGGTSYNWSGGVTNNVSFSPASSTVYTVTGTDVNGCQNTAVRAITVNSLPPVTASASNSVICFGNATTLNGGGALTYTWTNGVVNNSSFSPSVTTTYTVTGSNANGCQNSATKLITVNSLPVVSVNTNSSAICMGGSVILTGSGADTYTWTNGITNGIVFQPTLTLNYSVIGTHTLTGCTSTNVAAQTITVNQLPVISITVSNPIICIGSSVTLTGTNADTYTWSNGISNGLAFTPTVSANYTVIGTNSITGCSNTAAQGITVNPLPSLTVNVINPVICFGQSVTLNALGANTYSWTNSVLNTVPFTPTTSLNYTVGGTNTLTGCTNTATQLVLVNPLPIVSSSSSSNTLCFGNSVILSGLGANTYTWTNGILNGVSFSPSITTSYALSGTNTLTGCTSTNTSLQTIVVNPLPVLSITAADTVCSGESVVLTITGAFTYSWSNNQNGSSITVVPTSSTIYTVAGSDNNGCINSTTFNLDVLECVGINSYETTTYLPIKVFPNPNNGHFTISTDLKMDLTIFNELGQVVKTISFKEDNENYSIDDIPNGIYFIVGQKDNKNVRLKIMVAK